MLGYSPHQIEVFKIAATLERDYDEAMEWRKVLKKLLEDGAIDETTFIELMRLRFDDDERIQFELSLYKLTKGWRPT